VKKVLIALVVLVLLVGVGAVLLLTNLGSIIQSAVEKFGSDATGTKVTLAKADVSLTSGQGTLGGLMVGNPQGFTAANAFELGEISVKLDTASVSTDTIVVKEVVIQGPKVRYELGASLGSNLGKIQENVDAYTRSLGGGGSGGKSGGGSGGSKPPEAKPASGGETKFVIEHLYVRGGKVTLGTAASEGASIGTPLPEIHLTDIGKKSGGASAGEVASQILDAITKGSIDAAAKGGIEKAAKDALGGAVKGVTDTLGGLLGGKKKK